MRKLPITAAENLLELITRRYERASTPLNNLARRTLLGCDHLLDLAIGASHGSRSCWNAFRAS